MTTDLKEAVVESPTFLPVLLLYVAIVEGEVVHSSVELSLK